MKSIVENAAVKEPTSGPLKLFVSYSHADKKHRDRLELALSLMKRQGLVETWSDIKMTAGTTIDARIAQEMRSADVFLLLVSPDFLASNYCYEKELSFALERHSAGRARVVPIIVRPADWMSSPVSGLLSLPEDAEAVSLWPDEDQAWLSVSTGLRSVLTELSKARANQVEISTPTKIGEAIKTAFVKLQVAYESRSDGSGANPHTGLSELDQLLCGLHEGELVVLAGRPGSGFSELWNKIVLQCSIKKKMTSLLFSCQYPKDVLSKRLACALGRISIANLTSGNLSDEDWPRITTAIALLKDAKISLQDSPSVTVDEISRAVAAYKLESQITLAMIDSLNFVQGGTTNSENDGASLRTIARQLKVIAREQKIPLIVGLNIGPRLEARYDKRPTMADLEEWSSLRDYADKIVFAYRHEMYYYEDIERRDQVEFIVAHNHTGNTGTALAHFSGRSGALMDMSPLP